MNILTPVSSVEEILLFSEVGANEFYIGYTDWEWINTFNGSINSKGTLHVPFNRRTRLNANVTDYEVLKRIVDIVDKINGKLFVTVNAPFYTENMYYYITKTIEQLQSAGVRHLIVSDIGVMELLNNEFKEFKVTVSCVSQVSSCSMVEFYRNFNIERIVFPRHISFKYLCEIVSKFPDLEFESFALCEKCLHDDGYCRSMHSVGTMCKDCWNGVYENIDGTTLSSQIINELALNEQMYKNWIAPDQIKGTSLHNLGCSLCSIGILLKHNNIKSLKLSGRGRDIEFVKKQIEIVKNTIDMFANNQSIEYVQKYVQQVMGEDHCVDNSYCIMRGK